MFLEAKYQRHDKLHMSYPKVVTNTILKMPLSISPFLQPLQCSPHHEDTLEADLAEELSRIQTTNSQLLFLCKQSTFQVPQFILSNQKGQSLKKKKNRNFLSKRITLLKIKKILKVEGGSKRQYSVQFRYGNEAKTHLAKMKEQQILQRDPQLLIEILLAARKLAKL